MDGSTPAPVAALREQFGDGKPPDITRKITACVACRKQKIKCHMRDGEPPCTRCKKRGLPCAVNRSLQMILESDTVWKGAIERKMRRLKDDLSKIATHLALDGILAQSIDDEEGEITNVAQSASAFSIQTSPHVSPHTEKHTPHRFEIVMDLDSGPAAIPGSVIVGSVPETSRADMDIITRGIIDVQRAQSFLDVYQNRLDHFLYRILGERKTLDQVRVSSPLLLAAICAVGSLHLASDDFDKCYQEFVSIAAASTFSRRNNVDDIRGLIIGAFWLSGISWTCIGAAVRMSTDLQLHRSIFKALGGDRSHYLRTRLYYLVYVCDHHFSVPYGRPPMTREDDAIRASSQILETENAVEDDARLVSQVQLWVVGSEIYSTFGIDVEQPLDSRTIEPLRRYSIRLDKIRADWAESFSCNRYVGNYPKKGVGLHCHFQKLYLFSMAFRGIGKPGFKPPDIALDIDEIANSALLSATSILRAVISDTEIQSYLNGLPTYFDVMIAFAVVFVLNVSTKYRTSVRVDITELSELVADLVRVLKDITSSMHQRHVLVSVAKGAQTLLGQRSSLDAQGLMPSNADVTLGQSTFAGGFAGLSDSWNAQALDNFFMGEFDFLSNQDPFDVYQPDLQFTQMPQL